MCDWFENEEVDTFFLWEKDDKIEERQNWIKTKNKKEIKNYIMKKYNISI